LDNYKSWQTGGWIRKNFVSSNSKHEIVVDVCTFSSDNQAVSPVIATILMVSIVVILGAVVSVFALGLTESVSETAPQAQFEFEFDGNVTATDKDGNDVDYYTQVVTITHVAGNSIDSDNLIIRSPSTAFKYIEEDGDLGGFGPNNADYEEEVTFRQIDGAETMSAGDQVRIAVVYGDSGFYFCPCDDVEGRQNVNFLNESVITVNYDRGSGRSATLARWGGQDA